ncbi:MAG: SCO family protein [Thiohalobacteraceae bacterium]|nr:SCO family protein [Gammaproteobacteria bacterium]
MSVHPLRRHLMSGVAALLLAGVTTQVPAVIPPAAPAEPVFDGDAAYALSQAAVGRLVGDYRFTTADGREVRLADLRGRPVVVSLVYSSCYQICSMTTRSLAKTVRAGRAVLGDDSFAVLTIGFDTPVDTPSAMATFAIEQGVRESDWQFVSGDAATVAALTRDLGFTYQRSPNGFDHLLQTTILDADGRVHRQVYGDVIDAPWLIEPLKRLVFGTTSEDGVLTQISNRVRMYCVTYDPATGAYRYDYSIYIGMTIGGLIIVAIAAFLIHEARRARSV